MTARRIGFGLVAQTMVGPRPWVFRTGISPLIAALRNDPRLFIAFVATSVCSMIPFFVTPLLPLTDLGSNVGAAGLISDILTPGTLASQRYSINPVPVPYWPAYLILSLAGLVFSSWTAAKILVGLTILFIPLSVMRLLIALNRNPWLGLIAFLMVWDTNLYWGWVTFQLAMPLVLWAFAWVIESKTLKASLKTMGLVALIGVSHPHAVMWFVAGSLALVFTLERPLHGIIRTAVAGLGLLVLAPWLWVRVLFPENGRAGTPLSATSPNIEERLAHFYTYSLGVFTTRPAIAVSVLVVVGLLFGPLLFSMLERRTVTPRSTVQACAIVFATAALYFLLPYEIQGNVSHFWTYPRFSTWLLVTLFLVPAPKLEGRALWSLVPAALSLVALTWFRVEQFRPYGEKVRPYLEIIEAVPKQARVAPLDVDFHFAGFREPTLGQVHGFLAAERGAYDPHLFDQASSPILFRTEGRPPDPDFHHPERFTMDGVGRHYDYVVLFPATNTSLEPLEGKGLELVKEAGSWKLYKIVQTVRSP